MAKAKKLASGSWRVQIYSHTELVDDPANGTKKERRVYRSFTCDDPSPAGKRKAEAMAAEFALKKDAWKVSKIHTVREAMESYCDTKSNVLSPSTLRGYKSMMRNSYGDIAQKRTDHLRPADVQSLINKLSCGHSPKYVKNVYGFLSAVLQLYQPDFDFSPTLPQAVHPNTCTPSDNEISRLIEFFKLNDKVMLIAVYLAAFGTLRRSEVCATVVDDVIDGRLLVCRAMVKDDTGEWIIKTTKTYSSTRYVDLPDFVFDSFPSKGRLVPLNPSALTARFKRALKALNMPSFRFHDLRHYAASIMHALQVPDQYIMAQGGWKSDKVLKGIYRNALPDYQKRFIDVTMRHFEDVDGICNTKSNTQ